ncbi:hypothetical protein ATCC90586_009204 [Pythium insidiosum]|nr:hypothetical protein ATCC90586_009204 [Pythium insidiosum]
MAHDASFLARCEQFLLHPKVRALSLAERVDFLERKGLSPEEITSCLRSVEQKNGLARLALTASNSSAATLGAQGGSIVSADSNAKWWARVARYSAAAVTTLILAYGYARLRQRVLAQLLAAQQEAAARRRARRRTKMLHVLTAVGEQRLQYKELLKRVQDRVQAIQSARSTVLCGQRDPGTIGDHAPERTLATNELASLRREITSLKAAVGRTATTS